MYGRNYHADPRGRRLEGRREELVHVRRQLLRDFSDSETEMDISTISSEEETNATTYGSAMDLASNSSQDKSSSNETDTEPISIQVSNKKPSPANKKSKFFWRWIRR